MRKILTFLSIISISVLSIGLTYFYYSRTLQTASSSPPHPIAKVILSTGKSFQIELYPEYAPNTVDNFIYLATHDFYNDIVINRILPNYLVQIGDPIGNGYGFPGYFIKSECRYNGVNNKLKHIRGTVSMARSDKFNTEGSQFFVLLTDDPSLNGQYSSFGRIIEGIEAIEELNTLVEQTKAEEVPISIVSVTVDTFGEIYEYPQVLSPIGEQKDFSKQDFEE